MRVVLNASLEAAGDFCQQFRQKLAPLRRGSRRRVTNSTVAVYFNDKDRAFLFSRIEQRMERHGYLVIGAMEPLSGVCPQLVSQRHLRSVFYQSAARHSR